MNDIEPVLRFLASHPEVIANLRVRHVADEFGRCQGCPPGTPLERCQYLGWAAEAESPRP